LLPEFKLVLPYHLDEALGWLNGGRALIAAGATRLLLMAYMHLLKPEIMVSITRLGLRELKVGDELEVEANVTLSRIVKDPRVRSQFPLVAVSASHVADPVVRNKATLVGNIVNAVPYSTMVPAFLLMEGRAKVRGPAGPREILAKDFFVNALETAQRPDEIVTSLTFKRMEGKWAFTEFKSNSHLPVINVAVWRFNSGRVKAAYTGLTPVPNVIDLGKIKSDFRNSYREVKNALQDLSGQVIDDLRSSSEYRLHLASVLTARLLEEVSR
jgi:carbon-monoxide dehydrogenase medium subunit